MSCCNNNAGWGGSSCGCGTVQYAPPACNPNFPTSCIPLGNGNIVRVVGEDAQSCKYTVPTLASSSLLTYNPGTGLTNWADGSANYPIFLGSDYGATYIAGSFKVGLTYQIVSIGTTDFTACGASANTVGTKFKATAAGTGSGTAVQISTNQVTSNQVNAIEGTTPTGQLVSFFPSPSTETQFPIVSAGGSTTTWGKVEDIITGTGIVYKTGNTAPTGYNPNTVYQIPFGATNTVLTMNSNGVAEFTTPTVTAFIDSSAVNLTYSDANTISVSYGNLVLQNASGNKIAVNGSGTSPYLLKTNTYGVPLAMDSAATTAGNYYYVYAIYNPTTTLFSVVGSASYTGPTLTPTGFSGYTYYRLIGMFYTSSSNTIVPQYYQKGSTVFFGNGGQPVAATITNSTTYVYYGGSISNYAPISLIQKATLLLEAFTQVANQAIKIEIADRNSGTTPGQTTNTNLSSTDTIYGSAVTGGYAIAASSNNFSTIEVAVNSNTQKYNINLGYPNPSTSAPASYGLFISGYTLNIF